MMDDIEIIEDVKKESNFNNKEYFTLAVIMIILSLLQLVFTFFGICSEYINTITFFKLGNVLFIIGTIIVFILSIIIITNLTQRPKLSGISGVLIGILGFFIFPIITEIIGLLLFIDGIRLIKNS